MSCLCNCADAQGADEETLYGKGATKTTSPYEDLNGYKGTKTIITDANGTIREEKIEATKTEENVFGGKDNFKMESFTKYDCNGSPIYSRGTITKNGQEIRYEDAVYEPPKNKGGLSKQVSGFLRETKSDGTITKKKFDPKTGMMVEVANVSGPTESYASIEPGNTICPPGTENNSCSYSAFNFSACYSYTRAEGGTKGLGFPLGANISGTYNLSPRLGLTVDASFHYRKKDDQKWDRQYLLGGIEYLCNDCNCDCDEDNPHNRIPELFGHLLVGYARDGFKVMNFKNSEKGFAAAIGGGVNFKISENAAIKLKTDAIPIFFENNTTIDYRVGLGVGIGFGKKSSVIKNPNLHYKPERSN